jgi:hypothetical protein
MRLRPTPDVRALRGSPPTRACSRRGGGARGVLVSGSLNMLRQYLGASGICMLAFSACSDGPGPNEETETVQYQFALAAFGGDSTVERVRSYECLVHGFFTVPSPVVLQGSVRFPLTVERRMGERRGRHVESTSADSTVEEALLEYSGLGGDSLTFTLGAGSYSHLGSRRSGAIGAGRVRWPLDVWTSRAVGAGFNTRCVRV